jgi:hypothetical protein
VQIREAPTTISTTACRLGYERQVGIRQVCIGYIIRVSNLNVQACSKTYRRQELGSYFDVNREIRTRLDREHAFEDTG